MGGMTDARSPQHLPLLLSCFAFVFLVVTPQGDLLSNLPPAFIFLHFLPKNHMSSPKTA
jgi:hypothetical protein